MSNKENLYSCEPTKSKHDLQKEVDRLRKALEDIRDEDVHCGVTKGTYMYFKLLSHAHKNIAIETLTETPPTPAKERCNNERCQHPIGWHYQNTGSCLECACPGPTPNPPEDAL